MADETQLLYLEPDDEVTSVVRRLREADASRIVLVASGRTKATTSAVAMRLLAQVAAEEGREIALVADPGARALAAEAGIAAFASVADANAQDAVPAPPPPPARAPIHVVRGHDEPVAPDQPAAAVAAVAVPLASRLDETQSVPVQPSAPAPKAHPAVPTRAPARRRPRPAARSVPRAAIAALLILLLMAGAAFATVLPGATVTIHPEPVAVGPESYSVRPPVQPSDTEPLQSTMQGEASGHRTRRTKATGVVTLFNYSPAIVFVPQGTLVSFDGVVFFATTQDVSVQDSSFFFAGSADVPVEAVEGGTSGNVPADAINRVEDDRIDRQLRQGAPQNRRVRNFNGTDGGSETALHVVKREDVLRTRNAINRDLEAQLADLLTSDPERVYPTVDPPRAEIPVPDDLVGQVSEEPITFELTGTMPVDSTFVWRADVEAEAAEAFLADEGAVPPNTELAPETIEVVVGDAAVDGESIVVQASVTASAVPELNEETIRRQLVGMTTAQAEAALSDIGPSTISLWPGWVDHVPRLDWRIDISVEPAEETQ